MEAMNVMTNMKDDGAINLYSTYSRSSSRVRFVDIIVKRKKA